MQAIAKALDETPPNAPKPLLFHGPSRSGKKTLLRQALEARGLHVVVLDAVPATLRSRSLGGATAFIIDCPGSLQRAAMPDAQTRVVYVKANVYERHTAAQLNAAFKLVDLSRALRRHDYTLEVDAKDNNLRTAPWDAMRELTSFYPRKSFQDKLNIVAANPNLTYTLRDNAVAAPECTDAIVSVLENYSVLDTLSRSMNADLKATLEVLHATRAMNTSSLQYRGFKPPPFCKPSVEAVYRFSALTPSDTKRKKSTESTAAPAPKKRKPPTCRKCGRPRKGHGAAC